MLIIQSLILLMFQRLNVANNIFVLYVGNK